MLSRLPESVDPFRLAAQGIQLSGVIPVAQLERLRPLLYQAEGVAEVELGFTADSQHAVFVVGRVACDLTLQCQRCAEPFVVHVDTPLQVGLVLSNEESARLPQDFEPFLLEDGKLRPADLVEDELILALPIVPRHDYACAPEVHQEQEADTDEEGKPNPFAPLSGLLKN